MLLVNKKLKTLISLVLQASVGIPHALQDKRVTSASSPDRKFSVVAIPKVPNPESRTEERARTSVSSQNSHSISKSAYTDIGRKESYKWANL